MANSVTWKISLPSSASRQASPPKTTPVKNRELPQITAEAQQAISTWLSSTDISHLKDRDLTILASETRILTETASRDLSIWRAIPGVSAINSGERLVENLKSAIAQEEELGSEARATCELLGLPWETRASTNIQSVITIAERYSSVDSEIMALSKAIADWSRTPPSIQDAVFISAISSSLRSSDLASMSGSRGAKEEVERAMGAVIELDKAAADLSSEFAFDPSDHAPSAFGGIARAFASGRGQDFLSAARKLGIRIKGPDHAQRCAGLLRTYIDTLSSIRTNRHADVIARARLSQSILRRADVLSIDLNALSPAIRDIALLDFSNYPANAILSLSTDTLKLIEDNAAFVPIGTSTDDLASELGRQVKGLQGWITRQQIGLALTEVDASHDDVEKALRTHPPTAVEQGLALKSAPQIEPAEMHLQWLHEARMLPLSDEQLNAFVDHVAKQAA